MIENNAISSLSSKPAEELQPAEKKTHPSSEVLIHESRHDKVELSEQARLLSRANSVLNDEMEVQNDKVEEVTRQVKQGTYEVPVDRLADALLERFFTVK